MFRITSIRWRLTLALVFSLLALCAAAGTVFYLRADVALNRHFDAALGGKARALCALVQRESTGRLEVTSPDEAMPEFGNVRRPEYFQIWRQDGTTLARSRSLQGRDLTLPAQGAAGETSLQDMTLPDGRPGRAVRLRFIPGKEEDEGQPGNDEASPPPVSAAASPEALTLVLCQDRSEVLRAAHILITSLLTGAAVLSVGVVLIVPVVVGRGLRGLRRLAAEAAGIEAMSLRYGFSCDGMPQELRPICGRLNDLLLRVDQAFQRERRFNADVAHELRTPIAELTCLAEVALRWPGDAGATRQHFQEVLDIARQMESTVATLLALARCEAGRQVVARERVDLCKVVDEAWRPLASAAARRSLTFEWRSPAAAAVWGDRAMLKLVVTNLLSNAAQYCPAHRQIVCSVESDDAATVLRITNPNDSLTRDDMTHLVEPFWRKDAARSNDGHSGLGLSLAAAFAKNLEAELGIDLTDDGLVCATLRFPGTAAPSDVETGNVYASVESRPVAAGANE